jgi:hypothetical protein
VDHPSPVHSGDRLRQSYRQPDQISGSQRRARRGQAGAAGIISHLGRVTPPPPTSWPGSVFDIVFVFTRNGNE